MRKELLQQNREFSDRAPDSSDVTRSQSDVPTLFLEDVSAIPFVDAIPGVEQYQHRARVRAGDGDLVAASTDRDPSYERYNEEVLRLGSPKFCLAEPGERVPAVIDACRSGDAFEQICTWAKTTERLLIHPYMSIDSAWKLAEEVTRKTGVRASVVGPPPPALWVANDKRRFLDVVVQTCGASWNVETIVCDSVDSLVASMRTIARSTKLVGAKRTRCASAMGNYVVPSDDFLSWSDDRCRSEIETFMQRTEWDGEEPVLAVEWVDTNCSPSTQLWIPQTGAPFVEGVYEQLLEGAEKVFLGSRPSTLPSRVNTALTTASLAVGRALQSIGYVGRCSFDFIVGGDVDGDFRAMFVECNGRWGGTSTPMYLVDRVVTPNRTSRPMYRAQDVVNSEWVGASFDDLYQRVESDLYNPQTDSGRYLLYNVGPLRSRGKFDIISLGENANETDDGIDRLEELLRSG